MNDPRIQILCEYCKGITYNDLLGNCIACGAGRDKENMPKPEPKPHERPRWGGEFGVEPGNDFSQVCSTAAFSYSQTCATQGAAFAMPYSPANRIAARYFDDS